MNIFCSIQQNVINEAILYTFYLLLRIFLYTFNFIWQLLSAFETL